MIIKKELDYQTIISAVVLFATMIGGYYNLKQTAEAAQKDAADAKSYAVELKEDVVKRLDRIEDKLDQSMRNRRNGN